jgi:DUF1016 N-terminal domain/YhcG PDDEXK nuclease domain
MKQDNQFLEVVGLIKQAKTNAYQSVNAELINCYWQVGEYISRRIANATWGDQSVKDLAKYIEKSHPDLKGYNRSGLYRMKQFYETYCDTLIVAPLARQLQKAENQSSKIVTPLVTQLTDIRETMLAKIGWTHHLIIFARAKTEEEAEKFKPEHLGQLNFYLEALDRDVKKEHENPSIGILLCKGHDAEVVKYALNRTLSPALVASYQTQLPDKRILQQKWQQLFN